MVSVRPPLDGSAETETAMTTTLSSVSPAHTVYGLYARQGGKSAGFCGYYRTHDEAVAAGSGRVKRETMTAAQWDRWQAAGFTSRTGWAA